MPATDSLPHSHLERANELYWSSDRTVDEITRELEMGRSTLYGAVRPIDAGVACAECGEPMVFTNRSNREAGTATCPACTAEAQVTRDAAGDGESRSPEPLGEPASPWSRWRGELAAISPQRAAMVGGAAALGAMVGAAATRMIRG
jgi:hypothetical protein